MAVNLATKYEKQFAAAFKPNSYFEGKTNGKYTFDGANSIRIYSPVTTELVDYSRSGANRYGDPNEMDTVIQELTLTQDKGFTKTLDRGNYTDQMMSISAGAWMNEQIKGVVTPTTEKYAISRWVRYAGKVSGIAAAPTAETIVEALAEGIRHMTNNFVPEDDRYLYLGADMFAYLKLADQFLGVESLAEKALSKGVIGEFMGAKVVVLPTSYMPVNCYALLARKESLLLPRKISSFKTHNNPPGIDGWLMEGRVYYDAFVLGAGCNGVWALVLESSKQATPTLTFTDNKLTMTANGPQKIYYTIDGGDPRYDASAEVYSSELDLSDLGAGTHKVRAVILGAGPVPFSSDVVERTVTVS